MYKKQKRFTALKPLSEDEVKRFTDVVKYEQSKKVIITSISTFMRLELGIGLIPLAAEELGGDLLKRIQAVREIIALKTGIYIPSIRIVANADLKPFEYSFFMLNKEWVKYEIEPLKYLCLDLDGVLGYNFGNEIYKDPTFGLPCIYISKEQIDEALSALYTVVDSATILIVSIQEFIKRNISEIFTHSYSKNILESVSKDHPLLLEDCYAQFDLDEIKNILNKIIKKAGTLSNIDEILELLLLYSKDTKDCDKIVELVLNDSRIKNGG